MPARSYDARHRAPKNAAAKPGRLAAGLALPTAAAAALTFTATGAAVATSAAPKAVSFTQTQDLGRQDRAHADAAQQDQQEQQLLAARRAQAAEERSAQAAEERSARAAEERSALAARTQLAQRAARDARRKALAARAKKAIEVKKAAEAKTWQLPVKRYVLTSGFGERWGRMHAGSDFGVPVGTPLMAMSAGEVVFAGVQGAYGNKVEIRYWDGTVSHFAHMSQLSVAQGDEVTRGEVVGESGNSGSSTGPHLHLEIHPGGGGPVDPIPWLSAHGIRP